MGMNVSPSGTQLLTQVGAAGTGLAGSFIQAEAQKAQSRFERDALIAQARTVSRQAAGARRRGELAESRSRASTRKLLGAQRAALAAQGIDPESGSAAEVQQETRALGDVDAATVRRNARLEALGFELGETDLLTRARLARIGGRVRRRGTLTTGGLRFAREITLAGREFSDSPRFTK